nr:MAG TPA: hypothetical protein [Caudoviricetes sp.]
MRGRVLLDKHSNGLSEPKPKHQIANKVTKPIRRFRAAKYTPRKSTSLFISCDKHNLITQDGNTSKLAKERLYLSKFHTTVLDSRETVGKSPTFRRNESVHTSLRRYTGLHSC